jgi:hypothetical protein
MSLLISRLPGTDELQYRWRCGLNDIFGTGMAILERRDELIHISPNKGEDPIDIERVRSAKVNRDRYLALGIPCAPLPALD